MGEEGGADFPWKSNPEAARAHRDSVSGVIRQLDADIVVITETETKGVLEMMIAESLTGLGYRRARPLRRRVVASRRPLEWAGGRVRGRGAVAVGSRLDDRLRAQRKARPQLVAIYTSDGEYGRLKLNNTAITRFSSPRD